MRQRRVQQLARHPQPAGVPGGLVQGEQTLRQVAVVVGDSHRRPDGALPRRPAQPPAGQVVVDQELRAPPGGVQVPRLPEQDAGLAQRGDGQPVPAGHHLVVPGRLGSLAARGQQTGADGLPPLRVGRCAAAVVLAEHLGELRRRPGIGQALDAPGVSVQ